MKKIVILILVVAVAMLLYKDYYKGKGKLDFNVSSIMTAVKDRIEKLRSAGSQVVGKVTGEEGTIRAPISIESMKGTIKKTDLPKEEEQKSVVIYMKHGGVMRAKLLERTDEGYVVLWKGEKYTLLAGQVDHIEYRERKDINWKYKNDVVIVKKNGLVVDGEIIAVDKDTVTVLFREGGGELEMGLGRGEIGHLLFAPVWNAEDNEILERLKKMFPKMKVYDDGQTTILTDSDITWVRRFKKELNDVYMEIYLTYFGLFKGRKPLGQNFVVVFDDLNDYIKHAITDFTMAAGYFFPPDKTLYLSNIWGKRLEKIYDDWAWEKSRNMDDAIKDVKDSSHKIVLEGFVKELKDKYWDWISIHRQYATEQTMNILRHEFTHEVFNNWGLQDIIVPMDTVDKDKLAEKKKEMMAALDSKNEEKIEKLFVDIMRLRKKEGETMEYHPANTWWVEGLAQYFGTSPAGAVDERLLFRFEEMERKKAVNPMEFIMNFKLGSFPDLEYESMRNAYAESWAITYFLMAKYPEQFTEYLRVMADIRSGRGEKAKTTDDLAVLIKCTGKSLPELEKEFKDFMKTLPQVEDPDINRFLRYEELKGRWRQAWSEIKGRFI